MKGYEGLLRSAKGALRIKINEGDLIELVSVHDKNAQSLKGRGLGDK